MAKLDVHQFPCLSDNYGVLIRDAERDVTAAIDAPDAKAVEEALAARGWRLTHILTTHHHADHTAGNLPLKARTGCTIIGPLAEAAKVPGIDRSVADVGDTLFAMGCGRVIEGSAQVMWQSLQKLMALPPETVVYCGHEYTLANAKFALTIEPDNDALRQRAKETAELRAAGKPTLPTNMRLELETNPFLRPHVPAIQRRLGLEGKQDWRVFAEIRERKNRA
jgi:hydroxyacylglutathione hydrolase